MTRRAVFGLVAAVAGLGVLVAAGVLLSRPAVDVSPNVFVNAGGPIEASNSPALARDPRRPERLVAAYRTDRPGFSAGLAWSDDGGASWDHTPLPLPADVPACAGSVERGPCPFSPDVAFGPDGTLHVLYVNLEGRGNAPANLWLASSRDGGRTLAAPVRVAGPLTFQPRLAVGPDGTVHITWLQADEVGILRFVDFHNPVVAVSSTDGGRTFSAPVEVSDRHRERVGAATPVVDRNGDLVVLYQDFKDDRRDFENLEGPPWPNPFALVVTRSSDGGRSFSPGVELESGVVAARRFLVFLPEFPSLAAGPDGELHVAWADARNGDEDVFVRRSGDGGRTWDPPVRVNDNRRGDGTTQYLPRIDVAEDGRVEVVFLDRRRDRDDVMTDAFLAVSHDGGRTFDNHRISSVAFDSRVGPTTAPHLGVDFGSRLALSSGSDRPSVAAWTDTRLGNDANGRQDVVAARVEVTDGAGAVPWLLALGALLAVAAAWLLHRRRPS